MHHLSFLFVYYAVHVLLCVFTFQARSVLWCPLRFPHKTMLGSSLPPVVYRRAHVLFTLFVFVCAYWCPTHIVFLFWFSPSSVSYVVDFSRMSSFDCPVDILWRLCINIKYVCTVEAYLPICFDSAYVLYLSYNFKS